MRLAHTISRVLFAARHRVTVFQQHTPCVSPEELWDPYLVTPELLAHCQLHPEKQSPYLCVKRYIPLNFGEKQNPYKNLTDI